LIGTTKIGLVDGVGKVEPISGDGGVGKNTDEEKEFLSEIVKLINSVFGSELKEDDKVTMKMVEDNLVQNPELTKVLMGDNSESSKKDYFKDLVKENISDVFSEKYELYNKLMSDKIFPQFVSYLYETVSKQMGNPHLKP
jgi:hypothetical protein